MTEDEIFELYSDMVYKVAFGYAKNREDTDDIFQNVFLTYFKKKRNFDSEAHRKHWLIRVTINCAKDFLSDKRNHIPIEEVSEGAFTYNDEPDNVDIKAAINKLDDTTRDIVYMFYYEDMSIQQIADTLEMNPNTVKTRLSRARTILAETISE